MEHGNAIQRLLLRCIKYYQRTLSPMLPPACRFTPSCSHYGHEAIARHGAVKGVLLTLWRLLRCNPFSRGGEDPVPARRQRQLGPGG